MMEYRKLDGTAYEVSVIGMGCWAIGGLGWGEVNDAESEAAIKRALDLGVNFVDTAAVYGAGRSERVVGRAIKGRRERVVVATKCGILWGVPGDVTSLTRNASKAMILRECDESLARLGVEAIDLYQIHWPDGQTPIAEMMEAMTALVAAGKIRAIGVSNFSVAQLEEARAHAPVASVQPPYSLLRRDIELELLPYCAAHGVGVLAYSPLQKGLLTGKHTAQARFSDDDVRTMWEKNFKGERLLECLRFVEVLRELGARRGKTPAQVAINWVIHRPGVTLAICGAKRPAQVEDNAGAVGWRLTDDELAEIEAANPEPPSGGNY
jgi:aryl-alcohol dehydrogenase-like predicted oxidoreductase